MRTWKEREHALVEENHRIRSELAQQPDATRSTVMNARIIDDFHGVPYPDGVQCPPTSVSSKSNPLQYAISPHIRLLPANEHASVTTVVSFSNSSAYAQTYLRVSSLRGSLSLDYSILLLKRA